MPNLTITHAVAHTDGVSDTEYDLSAERVVVATRAYKDRLTLTSTAITVYEKDIDGVSTGNLVYLEIRNVGVASAYFAIDVPNNPAIAFEVAAGGIWFTHTDRIDGSALFGNDNKIIAIYGKGSTSIEVQSFHA